MKYFALTNDIDHSKVTDLKNILSKNRVINGKSYLFTLSSAKGKEWADQFISAVTANPGGPLAIVQNSSGATISSIAIV